MALKSDVHNTAPYAGMLSAMGDFKEANII